MHFTAAASVLFHLCAKVVHTKMMDNHWKQFTGYKTIPIPWLLRHMSITRMLDTSRSLAYSVVITD
ncbi:MAG: hypothetical protein KUG67_00400, partial [Proteobacteria bacterium]|nr:hypothetical protein [Pseudomonadota bacterium]